MPEVRKNLVTGELVILVAERTARPTDFARLSRAPVVRPAYRADCPFCAGNEAQTTETSWSFPAPDWRVRAFPNKFSVLSANGASWHRDEGLHVSAAAVGPHEVVCEARRHDLTLSNMSDAEAADVMRAWHARFTAFYEDPRVVYVSLFKNHGPRAGTSIEHAHSQIVGLPLVPPNFERRAEAAAEHFDTTGACLLCRTLEDELADGSRLVHTSDHFVAFIPWAALSPFHLWIFPRRHAGSFAALGEAERDDLGAVLRAVLGKVDVALGDPDYNLVMQSGPPSATDAPALHWYLSLVPRLSTAAGFEMGTFMYVNTARPEDSAARLREVTDEPR